MPGFPRSGHIYHTLLHDSSSLEYVGQAEVDEQVANAILIQRLFLTLDELMENRILPTIIFDKFLDELQAYFDEMTLAVSERRHGDALHMPLAISIRQLQEVIERLTKKFTDATPYTFTGMDTLAVLVPSLTELSVTPDDLKLNLETKYVNFVDHMDRHYVSALLQYVRSFAVQYHACTLLVSVDKCIIPIGEPACPVSTGVHGHNRSLVPLYGPRLWE